MDDPEITDIEWVKLDGKWEVKYRCPGCSRWGFIDKEQYRGEVSIDCPECEFHETVNLAEKSKQVKKNNE